MVNTITGRKETSTGKLKGKSPEERLGSWLNHFRDLLGSPIDPNSPDLDIEPVLTDPGISDSDFTLDEVAAARAQVREGKAPGEDGITPEVLKRVGIDNIILKYANCLLAGETPQQFSTFNIIPIPKKGNLSLTGNYRGIAITSLVAKIINKMFLNRIRPCIDPFLRGNQSGFRPGRSTTSQTLALRRIIEEVEKNNLQAVMVFIDFCKAFDSISHKAMFSILSAYGMPPRLCPLDVQQPPSKDCNT